MVTTSFTGMGTTFEVLVDAHASAALHRALAGARAEVARLEGLFSRFDGGSELSRLNRLGVLEPGEELLAVVERALAARRLTGGRFDPTVHDALVAAGYDRTFDEIELPDTGIGRGMRAMGCGGEVRIDPARGRIELGHGVHLDLGGIAKGWTADRLLRDLAALGPALVNAGGDLAAAGGPWPVEVEAAALTVAVSGGLATSGIDRRRWSSGGLPRHHLIDPATARPAEGDLLTVSAFAATATDAEIAATALFLAGTAERAAAEADAAGIPAVLVTRDGQVLLAGGMR